MRSKMLISGIAATGALETGFLSYTKLVDPTSLAPFCADVGGSSCSTVLSGPYSVIPALNIPIVSVAFVAYTAVAGLALISQLSESSNAKTTQERPQDAAILMLSTAMATFSGYLMILLAFVIHENCKFCYLSAVLSISLAVLAWESKLVPNATKAFVMSGSSAAITALSSVFLFTATSAMTAPQSADASTAAAAQILAQMETADAASKKTAPRVTTHSSVRAEEISARLSAQGAKMYGAYWCSHCYNQKQVLGQEAMQRLPYIECDKEGLKSQYPLCKANRIPGYPTWQIAGELYPGEKDLNELEQLLIKIEARGK